MKTITTVLLSLLACITHAQFEGIDSTIAEYDAQITEAHSENMPELVPFIATSCQLMLPAIGPVNNDIGIYFDLQTIESEMNEGEMINIATIRKVDFQVKSGSYDIIYTCNFDTVGNIIRYAERTEDAYYGCILKTYYFKKNKCKQVKSELFATEFCEVPDENQPEIRTQLNDQDVIAVSSIMENAKKFKSLLAAFVDLMLN